MYQECVHVHDLEVFGYKAGRLHSIQNVSDDRIKCAITCDRGITQYLILHQKETVVLDIDIWKCIRDRFMPYIETSVPCSISVAWESTEDSLHHLHLPATQVH